MKRKTRRLIKRALALLLAFAIVISFGLYNSMDRVLQAEALPDDSEIEVVDEYEDFEEEEADEEVVEVYLDEPEEEDEEDEAEEAPEEDEEADEADEEDEADEADEAEEEDEEEETTTIAPEDEYEEDGEDDGSFADEYGEDEEDDGSFVDEADKADASFDDSNDEDGDPGTVTDTGSGGGGGSGSKEKADKGKSVPDEEKEAEYEEESYYEDEGFVEFAATVPLKNERIIIEVKGNRATVSFTGEEQEEEGFTYEARGEKTKVDVSDEVILELADGEEARASGIEPGVYYMGLDKDMFLAESDSFNKFVIKIKEDGYLRIKGDGAAVEELPAAIEESGAAEEETEALTGEIVSPAEEETSEAETEESQEEETQTEESTEALEEETEAVELPPEIPMPARSFSGSAGGLRVSVEAPEGAFPEGTEMRVTPVYDVADQITEGLDLGDGEYVKSVKAVDITFYCEGEPIEPLVPIQVSLKTNTISEGSKIVHVDDAGQVTEMDAAIDTSSNISNATFDSDAFSIYAVVETGEDARLKVVFMSGDTELASAYVKQSDIADLERILYDPGAGNLDDGVIFKGWTTEADYTSGTSALTIAGVRAAVGGMLQDGISDEDTVTYHAMLFRQFRVVYLDEGGASLGQEKAEFRADETGDGVAYEVNMAYQTSDDEHNFEGWFAAEGSSNIKGHTSGRIYTNNEEITITGDVTFSVDIAEGHWLIFDENGKGATYNAPQFVRADEVTVKPVADKEMQRQGYTFGGWFADAECTAGNEFVFGRELEDKTTVYAKWTSVSNANYTVIIWKQNTAGDGYDFEESLSLSGSVFTKVNSVSKQGSGDNAYARVNGSNKQYTGFHLKEFTEDVTITPEGTAVVNVYYDRTEYTLSFQAETTSYTPTTSGSGTQYGLVDGEYVKLTRYSSSNWYYNGTKYTGTRYTKGSSSYQTIWEIKALYQQNISQNFPITGTNGVTYDGGERWKPQNSSTYKDVLVYIDLMPAENVTFRLDEAARPLKTMNYFVEALPGETGGVSAPATLYDTSNKAVSAGGRSFVLYNSVSARYNGVTAAEDFIDIAGFTKIGADSKYNNNGFYIYDTSASGTVSFYYARNDYVINFMDGSYVDGNGNPIEQTSRGQLKLVNDILSDADISSWNKGGADYYEPKYPGYVFEGWYTDDACTHPYTFTKMSEGGITVYAKWRQIQYRVFLHPNAGTDPTLSWGSSAQEMSFRVSYGEKISTPTGRRAGYEFVGWYRDEACTRVFSGDAFRLNETTVTAAYDKSADFTDPIDEWGNGGSWNSDITGFEGGDRFWITKKLDLYAKWRSTLAGAKGIGIRYDLSGGTGSARDTNLYVDQAEVTAAAAPKAPEGKQFTYWVIQRWDEGEGAYVDTDTTVFAGENFRVEKDYARVEENAGSTPEAPDYSYTMQLRAAYEDSRGAVPTHIRWFRNDGTDAFHEDPSGGGSLAVNEAVKIQGALSRTGYAFLGWALMEEPADGDSAALSADLGADDLFLRFDGGAYYTAGGTAVSRIAADEIAPYDAMFAVWEQNSYTVAFDKNSDEAQGSMEDETFFYQEEKALSTNAFTRENHHFTGWNTKADGSGASYSDGETVSDLTLENGGVVTLYAQWSAGEYEYTIRHYLLGTEIRVKEDETGSAVFGSALTAQPASEYQSRDLRVNSYDPAQSITVGSDNNIITIYYTLPLTISARTDSRIYDGTPLYGHYEVSGALTEDEEAITAALGEIPAVTNVADGPLTYLAAEDVSAFTDAGIPSYYELSTEPGTLTVTKRRVHLASKDGTKAYDGTALTASDGDNGGITISGDGFAEGEGASYEITGSRILAGASDNTFTYSLNEGTAADNYEITVSFGTLTVTDRSEPYEITVRAADSSVKYDGAEHAVNDLGNTEFTIGGALFTVEGLSADGRGVNAGEYPVRVTGTPLVRDSYGNNVTGQFTVHTEPGTLTIGKRAVTLTSASGEKEYDGSPLTAAEGPDHGITVSGDGFAEGEGASYEVTGSRTAPGSSENTFRYRFREGTLQQNYDITVSEGTLRVLGRSEKYAVRVSAKSAEVKYDGLVHELEGLLSDTVSAGGHTYMLSGLTAHASGTDAGTYEVRISGAPVITDDAGNDVSSQFDVEKEDGSLVITKRSISFESASAEREYNGTALTASDGAHKGVLIGGDGFAVGEDADFDVTGSQLLPGSSPNTFSWVLTGGAKEDNYEIEKTEGLLTVVDRTDRYEITLEPETDTGAVLYDGTPHTAEGFKETTFTINGETYTVSGISAKAEGTDAGTYPVIVTGTAVVTDAHGNDVTSQFSINTAEGSLVINRRNITLTSASGEKEYDGTPLTAAEGDNNGVTVTGDGFADGEGAVFSVTGARTVVGSSPNSFSYELSEGTKAANYEIVTTEGTLTVVSRGAKFAVTAKAVSGTAVYDGAEQMVTGIESDVFTVNGGTYHVEGLTAEGRGVNAGEYAVTVSGTPVVLDDMGNDVSDQFAVSVEEGSLTITRRKITLTSASGEKEYDGSPLTAAEGENNGITVTGDGFAGNEGADYTVTGSQLLPGSSGNTFSYRLHEGTLASNYTVEEAEGLLTVHDRAERYPVTVKAISGSEKYDGRTKTVSGLEKDTFEAEGHSYKVEGLSAEASAADAGVYTVSVTGTPIVRDSFGNDVSGQFAVTAEDGSLEITKRFVTLTSASAEKVYDGRALTAADGNNSGITIGGDGFAEGDGASFDVTGMRVIPGESPNTFSYRLDEGTGANNYEIETAEGVLTVIPRSGEDRFKITLQTDAPADALYDGTEHTVDSFSETEFEFNGQRFTVSGITPYASGTDAGTYPVETTGSAVITDEAGNDVTDQFEVSFGGAELVIRPRSVVLASASAEKDYDGSALTADEITVTGDGFAEGEGADYAVTGTRTLVGSSDNTFGYTLHDGTKTENYIITVVPGTLTVLNRGTLYEITVRALDSTAVYDGTEISAGGLVTDTFVMDGVSYKVSGLTANGTGTRAGSYPVHVSGTAAVTDPDGNDLTNQFSVTTEDGTLTIQPRRVTLSSADAWKEYDGTPLTADEVTVTGDGFAEGDGASFTVTGSQTLTGSSENSFTYELAEGTNAGDYIISTVPGTLTVRARDEKYVLTVKAAGGTFLYDGTEHGVSGFEKTEFTVNGQNYSIGGIEAHASLTHAGTLPVEVSGSPVVYDADGNDVSDQFEVLVKAGTIEVTRRNVTLESASASRIYNGSPLTSELVTATGDGFAEGEGAVWHVTGSQTVSGSSSNSFSYELNEGTLADDYNITMRPGTLSVTSREAKYEIRLEALSGSAMYDGSEHKTEGLKAVSFEIEGNTYEVSGITASAAAVNAGSYPVEISGTPRVTDAAGNDVTGEFVIHQADGTLEITKRRIVLRSGSASAEYNGNALTNTEVEAGGDGFAEGEGASYEVTGSRTLVGISSNSFTYTLNSGTDADNYEIRTEPGSLEVTGRAADALYEILLTAESGEFLYDGREHTVSGLKELSFEVEGNRYTVSGAGASETAVKAGSYEVPVTGDFTVTDADGNDVTDQFRIRTVSGTLKINRRQVELVSASAESVYTGKALTVSGVTALGDGFAEGEGASYTVTGMRILTGISDNTFSYMLNPGTDAANYDIITNYGTLTVLNRPADERFEITVRAESLTALYDGSGHTADGLKETPFVIDGETYTVEGLAASRTESAAGTYDVNVTGTARVRDAEQNDVTDEFAVHTEKGQLLIRKRQLVMTSASAEKQYNGTPLTAADGADHGITVSGDGFAAGEGASYRVSGSRTLVGISPNSFTYTLNEGTEARNYEITVNEGTLTVLPREMKYALTVTAASAEKVYDGEPLRAEGLIRDTFDLDGSTYTVEGMTAEREETSAGTYEVNVTGTPVVRDREGNDVSAEFLVTAVPGTLTIRKRSVTLTSADAFREYDGKELRAEEVFAGGDGFAEGEGASYSVTGSRVVPGESENSFSYTLSQGTDAGNYDIECVYGRLVVGDRGEKFALSLKGNSLETLYDGSEKSVSGFEQESFTVNDERYTVSGLSAGITAKDAGTYTAEVRGSAVVQDASGEDVTDQFTVDVIPGSLSIAKRSITLRSASASKEYDGSALTAGDVTVEGDGFADGEGASYNVTGTQLVKGSSANVFTYTLNSGTDAANYQISTAEGLLSVVDRSARYEITVEANGLEALYDGSVHTAEGLKKLNFDFDGHSYEVRGITATASASDAGTYPVRITGDPAVFDGEGHDVSDQFVVSLINSSLVIEPRSIVLRSASAEREYDGTALSAGGVEVEGDGFADGEGASYDVTGSLTIVGSSRNSFTYTLDPGTKALNYRIRTEEGTLTVLNRSARYAITVEGTDYETMYDGGTHTVSGLKSQRFTVGGGVYTVSGLEAEATGRDAGTYSVTVTGTPVIRDAAGNDVSAQFLVNTRNGELKITKRSVTIRSASGEKLYDGIPLTVSGTEISGDGFATGEGVSCRMTGSRTVTGIGENTFEFTFNEGTNPENYIVSKVCGSLTVLNRPEDALLEVDVAAPGGEFLYDGTPHEVSGLEGGMTLYGAKRGADSPAGDSTVRVELNGETYTISGLSASRAETDAGTYTVSVTGTPVVKDSAGNDVSAQFLVRAHSAQLTIKPRTVILTSGSASHAYNGRALTSDSVTVSGDGFAEGEGASYEVTGSRMIVGESENAFTYELNSGTKAANYEIRTVYGKLSVTNRDARYRLTVTAASLESVYDGTEKEVSGLIADSFTLEGVRYHVGGLRTSAAATDAGIYEVPVTGTAVVTDEEGNDVSDQFMVETVNGSLKIDPRAVTLKSSDLSRPYTGSAVSGGEVTVTEGSFAEGEGFAAELTGSRILVGVSPNSFTYALLAGTKASNYEIRTEEGLITVTNRDARYEVTLRALGDNVLYDGEEHKVSGFRETAFTVEGNAYTVEGLEAEAHGTEAGTYPVRISGAAVVLDAAGNDVTEQFAVSVEGNTLTIRALYRLTINYVDQKGEKIAGSFVGNYEAGAAFGPVVSPQIRGYRTETASVRSGAEGMPAKDVEIDVVYEAERRKGGSETTDTKRPEPDDHPDGLTEEPGGEAAEPSEAAGEPVSGPSAGADITVPSGGAPGTGAGTSSQTAVPGTVVPDSGEEESTLVVSDEEPDPAYLQGAILAFAEDEEPVLKRIEETEVPLAELPRSYGYWALINLLAAISTVFAALLLLAGIFRRRDEDDEEENSSRTVPEDSTGKESKAAGETDDQKTDEERKEEQQKRLFRAFSLIPAIASVIIFIRTEDLSNSMRLVDGWTILMIFFLAVQLILAILCRKKRGDEDGEEEEARSF